MIQSYDKREYQQYVDLRNNMRRDTAMYIPIETDTQKRTRIDALKKDFFAFAKYYFPHYCDADFGWFHKQAAKDIIADPNIFAILEWPREHAKSVFVDIFIATYLYCTNQLSGLVLASHNDDKAKRLLSDLQLIFEGNELFINDYGNLVSLGSWTSGYFATTEGIGFWAFGRGQSPRGVREAEKRPDLIIVDDIDDKVIVKNEDRVRDAVDWIIEDLYGAASIKGSRFIALGNRIHKKSILAHLVGDIEETDPKRENITHIKVYARENPRTHKMDENGTPAWKERYSVDDLVKKMARMGWRSSQKEYYHQHIEEGSVFKNEWIEWTKTQRIQDYLEIITYADPSFKNTKTSDYKAIVTVGKLPNGKIDILHAWIRKASISNMVNVFYDRHAIYGDAARYYIESNMLQDLFLDEFHNEGIARGFHLPIRGDSVKKDDKYSRIENMTPLFERGIIRFNEAGRKSPDMQLLIGMLLAFPSGHDDGPDALHGGISKLQNADRTAAIPRRSGKYNIRSR